MTKGRPCHVTHNLMTVTQLARHWVFQNTMRKVVKVFVDFPILGPNRPVTRPIFRTNYSASLQLCEDWKENAATARKYRITLGKVNQIVSDCRNRSHSATQNGSACTPKFQVVCKKGLFIHYWHLRKWTKEAAISMGIPNFTPSQTPL